jgi:hypothetical protein
MKAERLNGPWWHISSSHSVGGRQAVACVHGESKRGATAYAEMFEANARLIAAAPDLLEALKACDEAMSYMSEYDIPLTLPGQVKAAIAKAIG